MNFYNFEKLRMMTRPLDSVSWHYGVVMAGHCQRTILMVTGSHSVVKVVEQEKEKWKQITSSYEKAIMMETDHL